MGQHTSNDFIALCTFLAIGIGYAMFRQWRDDNAKKSMDRDIRAEWYEANTKNKRKR